MQHSLRHRSFLPAPRLIPHIIADSDHVSSSQMKERDSRLTKACVSGGALRGAYENGVRHERRSLVNGANRVERVQHLPLELGQSHGGAAVRENSHCEHAAERSRQPIGAALR